VSCHVTVHVKILFIGRDHQNGDTNILSMGLINY